MSAENFFKTAPPLPFQDMAPEALQIKISRGGYNLVETLHYVTQGKDMDIPVQFGGKKPLKLSSRVFDLNDPDQAYDLMRKILKRGRKEGDWRAAVKFKKPVFVILPLSLKRENSDLQLRTIKGAGKKGERVIQPHLVDGARYERQARNGYLVMAAQDFQIARVQSEYTDAKDVFSLKITNLCDYVLTRAVKISPQGSAFVRNRL